MPCHVPIQVICFIGQNTHHPLMLWYNGQRVLPGFEGLRPAHPENSLPWIGPLKPCECVPKFPHLQSCTLKISRTPLCKQGKIHCIPRSAPRISGTCLSKQEKWGFPCLQSMPPGSLGKSWVSQLILLTKHIPRSHWSQQNLSITVLVNQNNRELHKLYYMWIGQILLPCLTQKQARFSLWIAAEWTQKSH